MLPINTNQKIHIPEKDVKEGDIFEENQKIKGEVFTSFERYFYTYEIIDFETIASTCTDTDGGEKPYEKGRITSFKYFGKIFDGGTEYVDFCDSENTEPGYFCLEDSCDSENTVSEYFCSYNETDSRRAVHGCPAGCFDGACLGEVPPPCTDTDGGKNYFEKGEVSSIGHESSTAAGEDYCIANTLFEKYCENDQPGVIEEHNCEQGCIDGACIEEDKKNNQSSFFQKIFNWFKRIFSSK